MGHNGHNGNLPPSMRLRHLWPVADQVDMLKRQQSELIIEDLAARPLEDLTDEELGALIAELDRLDPETGRWIESLSDDELRAIAEG